MQSLICGKVHSPDNGQPSKVKNAGAPISQLQDSQSVAPKARLGKFVAKTGAKLVKNKHGKFALEWAVMNNHLKVAQMLKTNEGFDPDARIEHGRTALIRAVRHDDKESARNLINKLGADVNATDSNGRTPLQVAIVKEKWDFVEELINSKGIDLDKEDESGQTALHYAVSKGNVKVIEQLIHKGANINAKDHRKRTPLHNAAKRGKHKALEVLLKNNANITGQDQKGNTPLHYAAIEGDVDAIKLLRRQTKNNPLMDEKPYIDVQNRDGNTALHVAVYEKEEEAIMQLLRWKPDIFIKNREGISSVHLAFDWEISEKTIEKMIKTAKKYGKKPMGQSINSLLLSAIDMGYSSAFEKLIVEVSDVNIQGRYGLAPLHHAVWNKEYDMLAKLTSHPGINLNKKDENGETALHLAVANNDPLAIKMLVKEGAVVDAVNKDGDTPLHLAVKKRKASAFKELIEQNADVNARNAAGNTPLHQAIKENHMHFATALIKDWKTNLETENNLGETPAVLLMVKNKFNAFKLLIDKGADIHRQYQNGDTLLNLAIKQNKVSFALMLARKPNSNPGSQNNVGMTALHLAVENKQKDVVTALLRRSPNDIDINRRDHFGRTPIFIASEKNGSEIISKLLKNGADPNMGDIMSGVTPLINAIDSNNFQTADTLMMYPSTNFDPYATTNELKTFVNKPEVTALHLAYLKLKRARPYQRQRQRLLRQLVDNLIVAGAKEPIDVSNELASIYRKIGIKDMSNIAMGNPKSEVIMKTLEGITEKNYYEIAPERTDRRKILHTINDYLPHRRDKRHFTAAYQQARRQRNVPKALNQMIADFTEQPGRS